MNEDHNIRKPEGSSERSASMDSEKLASASHPNGPGDPAAPTTPNPGADDPTQEYYVEIWEDESAPVARGREHTRENEPAKSDVQSPTAAADAESEHAMDGTEKQPAVAGHPVDSAELPSALRRPAEAFPADSTTSHPSNPEPIFVKALREEILKHVPQQAESSSANDETIVPADIAAPSDSATTAEQEPTALPSTADKGREETTSSTDASGLVGEGPPPQQIAATSSSLDNADLESGENASSENVSAEALGYPENKVSDTTPAAVLFPYGDEIPPIEHEQTAEIAPKRGRARRKHSGFRTLVNAISWGLLLSFFAAVILALIYYRYASDRLYNTQFVPERTVILNVHAGDRLPQIIERMREAHLLGSYLGIDDAYLMRYLAWINNNAHKIKTGSYKFNATMSLSEIYNKLIEGSQDFKVTIPEGKTAREIAALVKRKNDRFDEARFLRLIEDETYIRKLGLDVPSLEGYLYPSTYFFGPGMKEEDLITMMVDTFKKTAQTHLEGIVRTDNYSFHEHVIMASLIEREARVDAERPLIASVIFNRLQKGIRLEIDATVHYAIGDWSRPLSLDDLKTSHTYNTYLNKGLPPGPICNPQIASLVATFKPAQSDFLYYVYKGDGSHAFAKTYEEHLANIRLYRKGGQAQLNAGVHPSATAHFTRTTSQRDADIHGNDPSWENNNKSRVSSDHEFTTGAGERKLNLSDASRDPTKGKKINSRSRRR